MSGCHDLNLTGLEWPILLVLVIMPVFDTLLAAITPHMGSMSDLMFSVNPAGGLINKRNVAIGICVPLVTIFFLGRAYSRVCVRRVWRLEDCTFFLLKPMVLIY